MTSVKKVKVALLALVAALVIAIPTSAFAGSIEITDIKSDADHDYKVYQLFTGTFENGEISGTQYGANLTEDAGQLLAADIIAKKGENAQFAAAAAILEEVPDGVKVNATQLAKAIGKITETSTTERKGADLIAELVKARLVGDGAAVTNAGGGKYTATAVQGYYFIEDLGNAVNEDDTLSKYMLLTVESDETPATITTKRDVPTVDKKVKEDSNAGTNKEWGEAGTYEVGQAIDYYFKGTMPADYGNYKSYYYKFTDVMGKGLALDASTISVVVKTPGKEDVTLATTDYTQNITGTAAEGTTLVIEFDDTKKITAIESTSEVYVYYTCRLTEDCKKGLPGVKNEVDLEFNNNPNDSGKGKPTGKTPKQYCVVFSFDTNVNKFDKNTKEPLQGAEFVLSTTGKDAGPWYGGLDSEGKVLWVANKADAKVFSVDENGSFKIVGLDVDDTYYLYETKVPAGYNEPTGPFEFKLIADLAVEGSTTPSAIDYNKEYIGSQENTIFNRLYLDDTDFTQEGAEEAAKTGATDGEVTLGVENTSGTALPSTGGIGTTIFTIVGIALIVAAAAIMVVRRRNATTA